MTYAITWQASADQALVERVIASIATEAWRNPAFFDTDYGRLVRSGPLNAVTPILWAVVSANDVNDAYASAVAGDNPNPGGDEAVVTDGMILANVQASWPPDVPDAP